jgi:hypothetical protein
MAFFKSAETMPFSELAVPDHITPVVIPHNCFNYLMTILKSVSR